MYFPRIRVVVITRPGKQIAVIKLAVSLNLEMKIKE